MADRKLLGPMYERVFEKYIANDKNALMWFEPPPDPDSLPIGGGLTAPVGWTKPPGGEVGSANHVLNDHSYCCAVAADSCIDGEPMVPGSADECLAWHENKLGTRSADAKRLGIPLFITEFGACFTDGPCQQEINQLADVADEHLIGWAYWQFKYYEDLTTSAGTHSEGVYNSDGTLQTFKVKALARSYMQRTQGTPIRQKFDVDTGSFDFAFTYDSTVTSPSIGYFSKEYYYENGITAKYYDEFGEMPEENYTTTYAENILTFTITNLAYHS